MATLTISIAGSSIQNGSGIKTIQDADLQTLIDIFKARIGPGATNGQALNLWFNQIAKETAALIKRRRQSDAVSAAEAGVPGVVIE